MSENSFVFYRSYAEAIAKLNKSERLKMYDAIVFKALDNAEPEGLSRTAEALYILIKPQIEANFKKKEAGRNGGTKGAEYGKLGGRPKAETKPPMGVSEKPANGNVECIMEMYNENEKKNIKEKAPTPGKHKYGEYKNVLLTDEELASLKESFNDWDARIERLSSYIASTGKTYKSHYATIRNWARRDNEEQKGKFGNYSCTSEYDFGAIESGAIMKE